MDEQMVKQLAKDHLVPLFSGAKLTGPAESSSRETVVAFGNNQNELRFKIKQADNFSFTIKRSQAFSGYDRNAINEYNTVEAFVSVAADMEPVIDDWYKQIHDAFPVLMIATVISARDTRLKNTIIDLIDQLDRWSRGTYEGRQHSAAIGVLTRASRTGETAKNILKKPFASVLSNGYDTAIICSKNGIIKGYEVFDEGNPDISFAPYRLIPAASWASSGKICLVLNRKGEILIFKDNMLCFARRCGQWHFLTHQPVIQQMRYPTRNIDVRKSIYTTCLDASFSGTGACIGVVLQSKQDELINVIAKDTDYLNRELDEKAQTLNKIIAGKKFQELARPLRQELVAIDGALILDHTGNIITAGAILKVTTGSDAGGRLAAAISLARLGVGIKVSQDGSIRGFHVNSTSENPAFAVM